MAIKKVLLTKKVSGVLYDIYPKTDAAIVTYSITQTGNWVDANGQAISVTSVQKAIDALYTKIGGADAAMDARVTALETNYSTLFQGVDDTTLDQIKEIADFIKNNASAIETLDNYHKTDVGNWTAGRTLPQALRPAIEALEGKLGEPADAAASEAGVGSGATPSTAFSRIARLETAGSTAADDIDALEARMDTAESDIDALEAAMGDDNTANTALGRIKALEDAIGDDNTANTVKGRIKALEDTDYAPVVAAAPQVADADEDVLYLVETTDIV